MKYVEKHNNSKKGRPLKEITSRQEEMMNQLLKSLMEIPVPNDFPVQVVGPIPQ